MKPTVTVFVKGGCVQHVECPPSIGVIVRDYDVEGRDELDLSVDENGDKYEGIIWEEP